MAMGGKGRRAAENAIASCRPFKNSTGSLQGTRGSTRNLGWLEQHTDARRIRELLSRAVYVVWSYNTPIAWVSEEESGDRQAYYVDESHSMTTSNHQSIAQMGLGEYETIGTRRPVRRPRRAVIDRPQTASVAELGERAAWAEAARREPTAAHVYAAQAAGRFRTNHRGVQYDSLVERDTSFERDMAEARTSVPADSPGYQLGRTEREQEATLARLLDPRYSNPDWVPGRDIVADLEAERRDIERVEREGMWRP